MPVAKVARRSKLATIDGRIVVIIVPSSGSSSSISSDRIEDLGGQVLATSSRLIRVAIGAESLDALANLDGVEFVRPPIRPQSQEVSEGVALMNVPRYHLNGVRGDGINIAIIDGGFEGAESLGGDLDEWTYIDFSGEGIYEGTDHGTACAEIVYDIAPGASFYFFKVGDLLDLENAKDRCIRNGVSIVNHSMAWLGTGFGDGRGRACDIANDAAENGILWVNSAGNYANSQHSGLFRDADEDGWHDFTSSGVELLYLKDVEVGDTIEIWLTWNDWPRSFADYDLRLFYNPPSGELERVAESSDLQAGTEPVESITYEVPVSGQYGIAVFKAPNARSEIIKLWSEHELTEASSLVGTIGSPADASGALAVGAIFHRNWSRGAIEPYSSLGPTSDGRIKPDLVAPTGVSTRSEGSEGFFGTSAAAPHVAGAAALLLSGNPGLNLQALTNELISSTIDLGPTGKDNTFGHGKLVLPEPPRFDTSIHSVGDGFWTVDNESVNASNESWKLISYSATDSGITVQGTSSVTITNNTSNTLRVTYSIAFLETDGTEIADRFFPADRELVLRPGESREIEVEFSANFSGLSALSDIDVTYFASFRQVTQAPGAAFDASPLRGAAPLVVRFTNRSTGNIGSYSWQFGDGATSSVENPSHTYRQSGSYVVSLTVRNDDGQDSAQRTITVTTSSYSASGRVTLSGQSVHSGVTIWFTRVSGSGSIPASVRTRSNGTWDQSGFAPRTTYRASPRRSGWTFNPASRTFSRASSTLHFTGTVPSYSASGRVTLSGQSVHSGVTIWFTRVSGSGSIPASVRTRSNGTWDQSGFAPRTTYRASPWRSGRTFNPASRTFSRASSTLHFTGTVPYEQIPSTGTFGYSPPSITANPAEVSFVFEAEGRTDLILSWEALNSMDDALTVWLNDDELWFIPSSSGWTTWYGVISNSRLRTGENILAFRHEPNAGRSSGYDRWLVRNVRLWKPYNAKLVGAKPINEITLPPSSILQSPFPTPFNATVTVPIRMYEVSGVSVRIFNLLGQLIATLYKGQLVSGDYSFEWDARDSSGHEVTSGIYIVVVEAETQLDSQRIVFVK